MKKSYKALVSDAAVFAAGNMLTKLIQFLLLPMYTALLTTEQYGIGELVNNTAELLYPFAASVSMRACFVFQSIGAPIIRPYSLRVSASLFHFCRLWQLREFSAIHLLALITHGNWSFSALLLPLK